MSLEIINTSNFKKWFGDWENSPETSSKVVDENGLPLVVHHGTDADFNEFSSKFIGQLGTQHGQGFYFTSNKQFAGNFGKNIKSFFLNIRKPLSTNELTLSYNDCIKLMDAVDKKQCEADHEFGYGILSDYGDIDTDGRENVLKSAVDLEYSSSDNDVEIVGSLINTSGDYNIVVNTLYELFGYDGIMCPEKEIYVIHHPNQAKEISNELFNPESNNMYESKKTKRIFVTENQYKQLINESQESKSIDAAKKLLISKGYTPEQADKFVRIDLRNDIPILRTPKGGKFIFGCTRMFLNRELNSADVILNLDKTLKLLISAHYNEYDRNLNGLSAEDLINRFADARSSQSNEKRNILSTRQFEKRDYNIVRINSFEEASKYSNYTSWCVTQYEDAFDSYTANGEAQFYFCLKNGFENIKPIEDENCPLDEYGLSMIAVCVDCNGDLKTCTCRWNHNNGGNDNILDEEQISNIVGVNFYQVFKPSNVIKEKIEALKGMTKIPDNYFQGSKIKEIIIPNNITSIEDEAFAYCSSLTSVTIPDSVTSIGRSAFCGCTKLTSITIPDSVTWIGMNAFYFCTSLPVIDSIRYADTYLVEVVDKTSTSYTVKTGTRLIGSDAFYGCTSLTSITIPDSVTSIGGSAFEGCTSLTSITIPDSVTSFGNYAFRDCTSLTSIRIPNNITSIGEYAFQYCGSLTSVTIPNSITSIGVGAFFRCTSLTSITIPDSVTWIGNLAFSGCTSLTTITIPNSVTSIGGAAFYYCTSLTSVTIPNSVTLIEEKSFEGCTSLTTITIPNSVTSIGREAFEDCVRLKKVIAPSRFAEQFKEEYNIDIIPSDMGNIHESMNRKHKRIFISESQLELIKQHINENSESYYVDTQKVLIVKKYLDSAFSRGKMNGMSPNGYPTKTNVIGMKGNDGEVIRNMSFEQTLDLLEDKFHNIYTNEDKRTKFLKAVLNDWYNKKITKEGMLSKNSF